MREARTSTPGRSGPAEPGLGVETAGFVSTSAPILRGAGHAHWSRARGVDSRSAAVPCAGVCGICGLLSPAVAGPAEAAVVRAAADAIRHRGPDHGVVAQWGPCTLGNRRLRVIDLATGDQPVANEDGSVVAVFNGEIYNFRTLRGRARGAGAPADRHRRHADDPAPLRAARRALRRASRRDVRARALGRAAESGSCSPATASARSRSSGRSCPTARSRSRPS